MSLYEKYSVILYAVSAVIASASLLAVFFQLKELVKQVKIGAESNNINKINTLLAIEDGIANRRLRLSESGIKVSELGKKKDSNNSNTIEFESATLEFNEAKQMYLNSLDRLCFCFIKGTLDENELRSDYRDIITNVVRKDFSDEFKMGTHYRYIKEVYEKWVKN